VSDPVNPNHYQLDNGAQVIDVTETLNFNLGNVVKYAARAGRKEGTDKATDLKKAQWYLNRELKRIARYYEEPPAERIEQPDTSIPIRKLPGGVTTRRLTDHPTHIGRRWLDSDDATLMWVQAVGWLRKGQNTLGWEIASRNSDGHITHAAPFRDAGPKAQL